MNGLNPDFDTGLLSRIEDAGLNASAPPQQRWMDGWLVRLSAGKAKRARCINAVAAGRLPMGEKLATCEQVYAEAGLPMILRVTPFTLPAQLDDELARQGFERFDDTRVMVLAGARGLTHSDVPWPAGAVVRPMGLDAFAHAVGLLRNSPLAQRKAHAERLLSSPVPFHALALDVDGQTVACGQFAREGDLVGLYDVFTAPAQRGQGLAGALCRRLLAAAVEQGASHAYLQVEGDNHAARSVYRRLGFTDAYAYHYRTRNPAAA